MKQFYKISLFSLVFFIVFGCKQTTEELIPSTPKKRLVLVYMIADNNLDYFAIQDINEMEKGFPKGSNDKLLVYIDRGRKGNPSHPFLLEVKHDTTDIIVSRILQTYPEHNSANITTFENILSDAFSYFPNERFTSKGLALWSHGNAWLPSGHSILTNRDKILEDTTNTKSFGLDELPTQANMDIIKLANALKPYHFDFLLFDACFMSSVEVAYQLKNTADYMIASSTEILSNGFPYQDVAPHLFEFPLDLEKISKKYYNYYNNKSGLMKSASISVIKMNEIENLASEIKKYNLALFSKKKIVIKKDSILQLDRLDGKWIYDLQDFLSKTSALNNLHNEYAQVSQQWDRTVIYEYHTPYMVEDINLKNCNGLSTYIPDTIHSKKANDYYKSLPWFKASGYDKIFSDF